MNGDLHPTTGATMPVGAPTACPGATNTPDRVSPDLGNTHRASEPVSEGDPQGADRVSEIRARLKAATPGPWRWFGDMSHGGSPYLAAMHSGRKYVMQFWRNGMQGAQPVFQSADRMVPGKDLAIYEVCPTATDAKDPRLYRHDIVGFRNPEADLIAHAPEDIRHLLELVEKLGAHHDADVELIERLTAERNQRDMDAVNGWASYSKSLGVISTLSAERDLMIIRSEGDPFVTTRREIGDPR